MRLTLDLDIPDALSAELQTAAQMSRLTAAVWAAQVIEAECAARRLPSVPAARNGARVLALEIEEEPETYPLHCPTEEIAHND